MKIEQWHEIKAGERIVALIAFRPATIAVRPIDPIRETLIELDLPLKRERRQPTVLVGLPQLEEALSVLPERARQLVIEHRPDWLVWRRAEEERQAERDRYRARLSELSGHGGEPPLPIDIQPYVAGLHADLYDYQTLGVAWLRLCRGRAIIGDDMGLGKTAQSLAFCEQAANARRVIVVAPTSVCVNWTREAQRWAPSIPLTAVPSKAKLRKALAWLAGQERGGIVITWGLLRICVEELLAAGFDTAIADEAHNIKELTSQRSQAFEALVLLAEHRLLLSGTSVRNRPRELYPLLRMVAPLRFPAFRPYGERYCGARDQRRDDGGTVRLYRGKARLKELNVLSRPYLLRREKTNVLKQLPPKRWQTIRFDAPRSFEREYKRALELLRKENREGGDGDGLAQLQGMRKKIGLAKIPAALEWLDRAREAEEPVVLFLYHKDVHALIAEGLRERGVRFDAVVGATSMNRRQAIFDRFQAGELDVLIGSEACKEGANLTHGVHTCHLEYWWVPGDMTQAEDRISRIGQLNATLHTRLHLSGSLDDHVAELLRDKQDGIDTIMDRRPIDRLVLQRVLAAT